MYVIIINSIIMPTHYTDCDECYSDNYNLDYLTNQWDNLNAYIYSNHLKIEAILIKYGFPKEIAEIIIKKSIELKQCDYCSNMLCIEHQRRANKWFMYYRHMDGLMCNDCCWGWVT